MVGPAMDPAWQGLVPPSPDQVAEDLASMYVSRRGHGAQQGGQSSYDFEPQAWDRNQAARAGQHGRIVGRQGTYPPQQPQSLGWGGEAFPENSINRIPCAFSHPRAAVPGNRSNSDRAVLHAY